jgi:hypothetical protein
MAAVSVPEGYAARRGVIEVMKGDPLPAFDPKAEKRHEQVYRERTSLHEYIQAYIHTCIHDVQTSVDGWMDGWMDGWKDGWIDGWMDGWIDGWIDGCMDAWILYVFKGKYGDTLNAYVISTLPYMPCQVIVKGAFRMEENVRLYIDSECIGPNGEKGTMIGPFAKMGKCKVSFPEGCPASAEGGYVDIITKL